MLDDHRDFERNLRRVLVNLPRVRQSVFYYAAGDVVRPIPEVTNHRIDAIRFAYGLLASTTGSND